MPRCDGKTDCKDAADELECRVIESNPSYNRFISPPGEDKLPVMTSVTLHSFSRLDPILASYRAEFTVILSWRDARLEFINLEDQPSKNTIGPAEMEIWFPNFFLDNTRDKVENTLDTKSVLRVVRSGVGVVSSSQETENKLLFPGRENSVQYERFYSEEFHCDFFLHWYPFDHQSCYIDIKPSSNTKVSLCNFSSGSSLSLQDFVRLVAERFEYSGPEELAEYNVKRTELVAGKDGMVRVEVRELERGERIVSLLFRSSFRGESSA